MHPNWDSNNPTPIALGQRNDLFQQGPFENIVIQMMKQKRTLSLSGLSVLFYVK